MQLLVAILNLSDFYSSLARTSISKINKGDTALTLALNEKKRDVVVVLVEAANTSPNYERTTPLHIAATDTAILLSELLEHRKLVKIDLNVLNREGNSPLHQATLHGEVPNMQLLLNAGADVNIKSASDDTPRIVSVSADMNIQDMEGDTPLTTPRKSARTQLLGY
jgi:ankyrin repeat protein